MAPISAHSVVNTDSCWWASSCPLVERWTLWSCVSNLIELYILFLRANFTSNTRWGNQKFHHDENSSGFFRRIFQVICIRVNYISRLFKQNYTTLNYTLPCITLHNIMFKYDITQEGEVLLKMRQCLKVFPGRYSRSIVTQLKILITQKKSQIFRQMHLFLASFRKLLLSWSCLKL